MNLQIVVGFSIEDSKESKIEQEPDRALDMAISEYALGRLIVVNKKTYKSGGIYNFHSKFKDEDKEHPAKKYFESKEYYKSLFYGTLWKYIGKWREFCDETILKPLEFCDNIKMPHEGIISEFQWEDRRWSCCEGKSTGIWRTGKAIRTGFR